MRREAQQRLANGVAEQQQNQNGAGPIENERDDDDDELFRSMDSVDFTFDMNGHIIGMVLSPDQRQVWGLFPCSIIGLYLPYLPPFIPPCTV